MSPAPRLIVLDLDGTLLDDAGEVSGRNSAALRRAEDDGARVVIATGRPPRWLEHLRADIPASIAVCCNGGLVMDLDSDTVLASHPLDGPRLEQAITGLRSLGVHFAVATEGLPEVGLRAEGRDERLVPSLERGDPIDVASRGAIRPDVGMNHGIPEIEPVLREAFVDL